MHSATNVKLGRREERSLLFVFVAWKFICPGDDQLCRTGVHTVADVFCLGCNERLGWYYHKATDAAQKYKEGTRRNMWFVDVSHNFYIGKYLLEREKLVKENAWTLDPSTES